jgi:hypothetical protein
VDHHRISTCLAETWFIGFLIFSSMGYLSLENLANKIGNMRKGIRRGHLDVRANGRVMKDLHTWIIDNAPAKRQAGGQVAAEEYAGVDVDEREVRALKRSRQAEEEDPSYLGDALPRGAAVPAPVTRAKVQKPHPARTEPAKSIRLAVPTVPTARPPPISMDAGPAPSPLPAAFGQPSPSNNPYTVSYPAAGAPYQKMNGSQPKQSVNCTVAGILMSLMSSTEPISSLPASISTAGLPAATAELSSGSGCAICSDAPGGAEAADQPMGWRPE